ncbi:acetyl-CoA acyltransferase [Pseudohyphozyma bogoriensis]|nr:acetyl-CoA acyltransferase [Pseudohyphozyma bogoriensis]
MAQQRLNQVAGHLHKSGGRDALLTKNDDDVVIVAAVRTPLIKAKKGQPVCDVLLKAVLKEVVARGKIDPAIVEDVLVGNVLSPGGGGASMARMAALAAGLPNTTSVAALNRQCSSGLTAVAFIAHAIQSGSIDVGIGAGVEDMTLYHFNRHQYRIGTEGLNDLSPETMAVQEAADCLIPMGITSENVAEQYHVSRERQDAFAANSYAKAEAAQAAGNFKDEIVTIKLPNGKTIDADNSIRKGTTAATLGKLKPSFRETGSTTAGNASQLTDGAAAVLLMRRSKANELGLNVIGKFGAFVTAGVPPKIMGIGPAVAIPKLWEKTGLREQDVDFYEINEAFASQAIMSIDTLKIPYEKVNPNGGAIALGHPLGATGARQLATGFNHAKRTGQKLFVTSMCIGSGMGAAAAFVNEQ